MSKQRNPVVKVLLSFIAIGVSAAVLFFSVCSPAVLPSAVPEGLPPAAATAPPTAQMPPEIIAAPPETIAPAPETDAPSEPADEPSTPNPGPIPQREAFDVTGTLVVTLPDRQSPADILIDGDYTTKRHISADIPVSITSPDTIHSLYMIWEKPPGKWLLEGTDAEGAGTNECGADGFIHEYVELSYPASEMNIYLPPEGAVLCDIYAFTEGHPPEWVQTWQPPAEKADLLVLPTHADDEHLFFVGTMPYYAGERGYIVQVAYMTNHWNEPPRSHELLDGLWTVGIRNYPVISGFNDRYAGTLEDARSIFGYDNIVNYHTELLRRFKPSVVVGHDLYGEYGHGAHMLNAHALRDAVEYAADPERHAESYKQYGVWDTPKLYLHLYTDNQITMDWDIPLESFDGATAREMAVKGYDCHVSQHRWSFAVPLSGRTGSVFGLVRTTVGPDTKGGDMFENISV